MTVNITSVTVLFGHGIKREEYGPTKKAEVSITASVGEQENGEVVLAFVSSVALAQVAALLDAPKPDAAPVGKGHVTVEDVVVHGATEAPPKRRGRPPKDDTGVETAPSAPASETPAPASDQADDGWEAGAEAIQVTDQEILSSLSKRAQELGSRDPCIKLVASFATRTEGPPFKAQEIPQSQRKDFLEKLAKLTA